MGEGAGGGEEAGPAGGDVAGAGAGGEEAPEDAAAGGWEGAGDAGVGDADEEGAEGVAAEGAEGTDGAPEGAGPGEVGEGREGGATGEGEVGGEGEEEGVKGEEAGDEEGSLPPGRAPSPEMLPVSLSMGDPSTIEGFDDDMSADTLGRDSTLPGGDDEEADADSGDTGDGRSDGLWSRGVTPEASRLEEDLRTAREEETRLREENERLQIRLLANRKTHKMAVGAPGGDAATGLMDNSRFAAAVENWWALDNSLADARELAAQELEDAKAQVEVAMERAEEIQRTFWEFKAEVARSAQNSRTGKTIPPRLIAEIETTEAAREAELGKARLRNIQLMAHLRKLEARLKQKEELAEGLHLIDFEQLKIENQSLNEKIEERSEELLKLRKKTTTTVQIVTHLKEKLQFVQKENRGLLELLQNLEGELAGQRDRLARAKQDRDRLRQENGALKASSGQVTNPVLLRDLQEHRVLRDDLLVECQSLKQEHESLMAMAAMAHMQQTRFTPPSTAGGA